MGKKDSFFKVNRSLLEHSLWLAEPFTKGQAWLDLIGLAAYSDHDNFYNGQHQKIRRGQLFVSYGFLQKRWKWSRGKVHRYLMLLVSLEMCSVNGTTNGTTITIEKYAFFQGERNANGTTNGTTDGTTDGIQQKKEYKKVKRISEVDKLSKNPKGHFSVDKDGNEIWVMEA